jgi:hypothetical protein
MSSPQHPDALPEMSDSPDNGLVVTDGEALQSVTLLLNGTEYRVQSGGMTVAELRALPYPPISPDYDLWLETPDGADKFLSDTEQVQVGDGIRLHAVPRSILAGRPLEGRQAAPHLGKLRQPYLPTLPVSGLPGRGRAVDGRP